jgi:hypothetical protein
MIDVINLILRDRNAQIAAGILLVIFLLIIRWIWKSKVPKGEKKWNIFDIFKRKTRKHEPSPLEELKESEEELEDIERDVREMTEPERREVAPDIRRFHLDLQKIKDILRKLEADKRKCSELNARMREISVSSNVKQARKAEKILGLIKQYQARYNYDVKVIDNVIDNVRKEIDRLLYKVSGFAHRPEAVPFVRDLKDLARRLEAIERFYVST